MTNINTMSLLEILNRCREYCSISGDALYSDLTIAEIIAVLNRGIVAIERNTTLNRSELKILFAPTSSLQDTSIANGWSEEYLLLSARFDTLIE